MMYTPDFIERHPVATGVIFALLFAGSIRPFCRLLIWIAG